MAEYYISYFDLEDFLTKLIDAEGVNNKQFLKRNKAALLAALTGDFEDNSSSGVKNLVTLWHNFMSEPSQLRVCRKYIQIQSVLCDFLEIAITSGVIEYMMLYFVNPANAVFPLTGALSIAWGLWKIFSSIKELNDRDFCVYMQATTHFHTHKEFTIDELKSWFPNKMPLTCNMHNSTWNCDYLKSDDSCSILCDQKLDDAVKSLLEKGLLDKIENCEPKKYKFKW